MCRAIVMPTRSHKIMRLNTLGKRTGLLIASLVIAISANLGFFVPAHAANAKWINRATIFYNGFYFVDSTPFDTTYQYISQQPGANNCQPDHIIFHDSSNRPWKDLFYDQKANAEATVGGEYDHYDLQGGSGANSNICVIKTVIDNGAFHIDNPDARRITFVHMPNGNIQNIFNGATFTPAAASANIVGPTYLSADTDQCKDTIVDVNDDPTNDDWFGTGRTAGSAQLYAAEDNRNDLGRTSESLLEILGGLGVANSTVCKINGPSVEVGGKFPITFNSSVNSDSSEGDLTASGWAKNGGTWQIQTSGQRNDDSYIIFIGTQADNTVPGVAPGTVPGNGTGTTGGGAPGTPVEVCEDNVSGLGHILCPLLNGFDSLMKTLYTNIIIPLLTVPAITTIDGLKEIWNQVLIVANILFVIVFFIVIFSQATSAGISNYGIKSLLPKLIAVAILANLSYYICVLAVDVANIMGAGITALIAAPLANLQPVNVDFDSGSGVFNIFSAASGVTFVGMAVAAQGGIIAAIAALAIPIVLSIIATVFILIIRLTLIVGFIALSPIIFIGFILPGTSRTASRLLMGFLNLLWIGPIIMAMVALGTLVSYVISLVLQ